MYIVLGIGFFPPLSRIYSRPYPGRLFLPANNNNDDNDNDNNDSMEWRALIREYKGV